MSESTSDAQKWEAPPFGTPCWLEIPATDVQACKKFYASLFPSWEFKPATETYTDDKMAMWKFAGPSGLSGGIRHIPAEGKAHEHGIAVGMTVFLFVESIEDTQKRAEELGGTVVSEKEDESDDGWYMYLKDVAGNRFGIYQLKSK